MQEPSTMLQRRTAANVVFDTLQEQINSLELPPGTKLSEADVARRLGVSRQPVREAFSRLDSLELLLVRPQKATLVRGFSMERVKHSRFLRLAVELEAIQQACSNWNASHAKVLQRNLELQHQIIDTHPDRFHVLDFEFHTLICELGGCPMAIDVIRECRQKIERLCSLSLDRPRRFAKVLDDHEELATALSTRSAERAIAITRKHLGRLDSTIDKVYRAHTVYFE